jgi:hypothetical protein
MSKHNAPKSDPKPTTHAASEHELVTPGVKYEFSDANVRGIVWFGVALVILAIGTDLLMRWTFTLYASPTYAYQPAPTAPQPEAFEGSYPRRPLLEGLEPAELHNNLMKADLAKLTRYEWVNKEAGVVNIPINKAMEIVRSQLQVGDANLPLVPRLPSRSNSGRKPTEPAPEKTSGPAAASHDQKAPSASPGDQHK